MQGFAAQAEVPHFDEMDSRRNGFFLGQWEDNDARPEDASLARDKALRADTIEQRLEVQEQGNIDANFGISIFGAFDTWVFTTMGDNPIISIIRTSRLLLVFKLLRLSHEIMVVFGGLIHPMKAMIYM